ncbi:MAG: helix-turn-helix domain-containing protein [Bacteroidales bacterium]|nr:helix-turn-helix domain-containing protein [Bacteroidales bacterium]
METIERILGHAIPIPPEPFIPESELRPLTEADFQRLFEEFCAAPVIMPPADYWTETTTETPAPLPVAKEFSATTARQPRRHRPTDQEKSISTLKAERFVTISAAARILRVSRPTIYAMIERGDVQLVKLGPNTNRIDLQGITDQRNSFPPVRTAKKKIEQERKKYFSAREAAEKFKKDEKTIKARAAEAGVAVAWFNGAACFSRKGLEKLFPGEKEKHDYLTVAQLAEECGISKQTVYDFIHDHHLPRKREGRSVLIDRKVWEKARKGTATHADGKEVSRKEIQRQCAEARDLGYVTISDAARHFGIHRGHLYYYAKKHELKTIKLGGQVFYDKKQLYKILKEENVSNKSNTQKTRTAQR